MDIAIDYKNHQVIPALNNGDDFISPQQVKIIFPVLKDEKCMMLSIAFNDSCKKYGLNKPGIFHEYVATCGEESECFTKFDENLNYSAARLMQVWPTRFKTLEFASKYAKNPQKLANYVYANRNGNGPESSGDGWKNRGGGAIMITGEAMWERYAKYINMPVDRCRDVVRNNLTYAIDSSCWVFAVEKKLIDEAENDDLESITRQVNGALTNFANRKAILLRAKKALPI